MKKNSRSKLNKGKTLGIVAATLATISLAGVGYASWNIVDNGKKTYTGVVNVTIGEVVDGSTVSIVSFAPQTSDILRFDSRPREDEMGKTYLFSNVTEKNEDLSVTMNLTVKALASSLTNRTVYYGVKINGYNETNGFGLAIKNNWIAKPGNLGTTTYPTNTSGNISSTADDNGYIIGTINIIINFTWGGFFNNTNPIDWAAGSGNSAEGKADTDIIKAVRDLHTALSSSLKLDVKVSNEAITNK